MADIQGWKEFMAQIMPLLYRQKMQKGQMETWLQNALKQYAAQEASSKRLGQTRFDQSKLLELVKAISGGTEGKIMPGKLLSQRAGEMGIDFPGTIPVSKEDYSIASEPPVDALKQIAIALGSGDYPSEEAIGQISSMFGEEVTTDFLDDFLKEQGRKEGLVFDEKKLLATLSGQDLEKGRQKIETRKLDIEESGKGEKSLTKLGKMVSTYNDQIEAIEGTGIESWLTDLTDKERTKLKSLKTNRDIAVVQMEEHFPDIGKLSSTLSLFQGEGITPGALEKNKEAVKKEYKLSEEEFQYIKAQL